MSSALGKRVPGATARAHDQGGLWIHAVLDPQWLALSVLPQVEKRGLSARYNGTRSARVQQRAGQRRCAALRIPDALLVTTVENAQRVKGVVESLKLTGRGDVL